LGCFHILYNFAINLVDVSTKCKDDFAAKADTVRITLLPGLPHLNLIEKGTSSDSW